jgi:hypothetical protein
MQRKELEMHLAKENLIVLVVMPTLYLIAPQLDLLSFV